MTLRGARCAAALLVCSALLAGCRGAAAPAPAGRVGASIAVLASGELAVVNPDQGSVSFVDPGTLLADATVQVGGDPRALLEAKSGLVWVATMRGGEVAVLDPVAHTLLRHSPICQGPAALAESVDGSSVAVACEWSGQIVRVDEASFTSQVIASGLRRPRAVALIGSSLLVAEFVGGDVLEFSPDALADGGATSPRALSLVPATAPYRPELTLMTANLADALVPAFGHLFVLHELVNHTGDSTSEATADDYGTVLNGAPKINAAVTRLALSGEIATDPYDVPPIYSRFDLPQRAFSGPVAAAPFGQRYLLVAHQSTNDVALLDTEAAEPAQRLLASFSVGAGPAGIAVDAAQAFAYVDNALDGSISRLDLTAARDAATAPVHPAQLTQIRGLPFPYSQAALDGRRLFFDATNPHVTPSRVVACASCHPGGGEDGLVWFIHTPTIPLKRRRTPDLANAHSPTAPFHWDGQYAAMSELTSATITGLMGGDGLLVETANVQAFVDEMVQPPLAPQQDPALAARGQAIFQAAGSCASCHAGADLTDNLRHAVLNPATLSADDPFTAADTPSLHGLFLRSGFFHDGRAPSLLDALARPDAAMHADLTQLSPADQAALLAYLQTL